MQPPSPEIRPPSLLLASLSGSLFDSAHSQIAKSRFFPSTVFLSLKSIFIFPTCGQLGECLLGTLLANQGRLSGAIRPSEPVIRPGYSFVFTPPAPRIGSLLLKPSCFSLFFSRRSQRQTCPLLGFFPPSFVTPVISSADSDNDVLP